VQVTNLSYKGILKNLSFSVPSGAFMVIRGPSGDGKTTLLRLLRGTNTPDKGSSVLLGGEDIQNVKRFGDDGLDHFFVSSTQEPPIFKSKDVRDNLCFMSQDTYTDDEYRRILRVVGLGERFGNLDEKPAVERVSGGEKKRFGLARALLRISRMEKGVVLFDEPTSSLDEETKADIIKELMYIQDKKPGLTIIAISHDKELYMATRHNGEKVLSVRLSELEESVGSSVK
jgi:multiple sugar transport system ATP-binding protein